MGFRRFVDRCHAFCRWSGPLRGPRGSPFIRSGGGRLFHYKSAQPPPLPSTPSSSLGPSMQKAQMAATGFRFLASMAALAMMFLAPAYAAAEEPAPSPTAAAGILSPPLSIAVVASYATSALLLGSLRRWTTHNSTLSNRSTYPSPLLSALVWCSSWSESVNTLLCCMGWCNFFFTVRAHFWSLSSSLFVVVIDFRLLFLFFFFAHIIYMATSMKIHPWVLFFPHCKVSAHSSSISKQYGSYTFWAVG